MTLEEAKKLSPEEINRVIAEALGWKLVKEKCPPDPFGDFPDGFVIDSWVSPEGEESKYPDYFHDLNACNEAFGSLPEYLKNKVIAHFHWYYKHEIVTWKFFYTISASDRAIALACVLSERKK